MRGRGALRVLAHIDAVDRNALELRLVLADVENDALGDVALERHRVRGQKLGLLVDLLADLLEAHAGDLRDPLEDLHPLRGDLGQLVLSDLERQGRAVAHQDIAVAIEDLAAWRLHSDLADAVSLRLGQVAVAGEHLQVPEAKQDHSEQDQRDPAQDRDAPLGL